jgi:hypothetical protein
MNTSGHDMMAWPGGSDGYIVAALLANVSTSANEDHTTAAELWR